MARFDQLQPLFADKRTTLAQIKEAGWRGYGSSGGGWWWVKDGPECRDTQFVPNWVHEVIDDARRTGEESVRDMIKHALGLKDKKQKPSHPVSDGMLKAIRASALVKE